MRAANPQQGLSHLALGALHNVALLAIFAFTGCGSADSSLNSPESALAYCPTPLYDAGEVLGGSKIEHTFEVLNNSESSLAIQSVRADCGCTVVKADREKIAPHGSFPLTVSIDVSHVPGHYRRTATVAFQADAHPAVPVVVVYDVRPNPELFAIGGRVDFGEVTRGAQARHTVVVSRYDGSSVGAIRVSEARSAIRLAGSPTASAARPGAVEVPLVLQTDNLPLGAFRSLIEVRTDVPGKDSSLNIELLAKVCPPQINGLVESLFVDQLEPGTTRTVPLARPDAPPFQIRECQYEGESGITVTLPAPDGSISSEIQLISDSRPTPALIRGKLKVRTDVGGDQVHEVPVVVMVPATPSIDADASEAPRSE